MLPYYYHYNYHYHDRYHQYHYHVRSILHLSFILFKSNVVISKDTVIKLLIHWAIMYDYYSLLHYRNKAFSRNGKLGSNAFIHICNLLIHHYHHVQPTTTINITITMKMYHYLVIVLYGFTGKDTVRSIKNPKRMLGRARSFSRLDIIKINAVYDCKGMLYVYNI